MTTRALLALAWRESRTGRARLFLFLSAISLGVAALVAVQGFASNLRDAVRDEARGLLGADLVLSSRQPFGERAEGLLDSLSTAGARVARRVSFASMARVPAGATRLVQVRAPEPGYPFYGVIETRPAGAWRELHEGRNTIVDPALLATLGAAVGDSVSLGDVRFRVVGVVDRVPGDADIASAFAPRMFIPAAHVEATGLLGFGSRVDHEAFVRLTATGDAGRVAGAYRASVRPERVRVETAAEEQEDLEDAFGRLSAYLSLVAVLALLLGAIGVASAMAAYMARKIDSVAVLRCLGATARQVFAIYLVQAGVMGLAGAAVGAALGTAVQWVLPSLTAGLVPVDVVVRPSAPAIAVGLVVGVTTALAAAAAPLLAVRRVPPLRALRRDVEPLPGRRGDRPRQVAWAVLALGAFLLTWLTAGDAAVAIGLLAGVAASLAALWGVAAAISAALRRFPRARMGPLVRHGLANLHRPGNQTRAVVVALGFGVFLLAALVLTQHNLLLPLRTGDAGARPNLVLWDVQHDQIGSLETLISDAGFPVLQRAPIVPMRVASIDGRSVVAPGDSAHAGDSEDGAGGWAVRREYRSTYRERLGRAERVVRGEFWTESTGAADEVSLEREIAAELGVDVGDVVTWDVQGVPVRTRVTSIREVDWARFEPNFFAVFPPAALAGAPRTWVVLTRAGSSAARADLQARIVARFPNVAAIDLTVVQAALDEVVGRISAVIRFLGGFSLATGFVVLLGAVAAGRAQRVRESLLLRTLGASRRQVAAILTTEYLALGGIAALCGIVLACGAAWALARWMFEVPFELQPLALISLCGAVVALSAVVGLWASREVFGATPLEALREEG